LSQSLEREPAVLICDAAVLDEAARQIAHLSHRPLLVVLGDTQDRPTPEVPVDARLPSPLRPARLRALLHHLLLEDDAEEE